MKPHALLAALVVACSARSTPSRASSAAAPVVASADASVADAAPDPAVLCAAAGAPVASLGRPALVTPPEPHCNDDDNPFCDTVNRAPAGSDACFVANDHIALAERSIRAAPVTAPPAPPARWDRATAPRYAALVDAHLHLSADESAALRAHGFVALDRHPHDSYATAFHEIFRQQLPVFVSVDAILHAIYSGHGAMLMSIESDALAPALVRTLTALRRTLAARRAQLPPPVVSDLDVYLTVAQRLLHRESDDGAPLLAESAAAVDAVLAAEGERALAEVELFGRRRMVDFSQFTPRGHYASGPMWFAHDAVEIEHYFRAMTWLSRLEFNLVSRDCRSSQPGSAPDPAETPREAVAALALAELAEASGSLPALARFEQTYATFAGHREDASLPQLLALGRRAGVRARDPDAFPRLRAAIGEGFVRTARLHFMPEGVARLPVIATMFGARTVPDVEPLEALVHDRVPDRTALGFADVGYLLGHDRARAYLADDLARFPTLAAQLDAGRARLRTGNARGDDLYRRWLTAVLALAAPTAGAAPSFMRTEAWADARLNSALVGYAQIRHNYVLLAGQGYDSYGCEIPDGYVEPAVEVYDALVAFARRARAVDPAHAAYFARVEGVLGTLRAIAATERAGRPLSEAQRRWLGMVSEYIPSGGYGGSSGAPPKYTGWYFDLFPDREIGAQKSAVFVADYFTLTNAGVVRYLGAEAPRLAVFVVDAGGPSRLMVGPVARGFEASSAIDHRLDDAHALRAPGRVAPWRRSYSVDDDRPRLVVRPFGCGDEGVMRYAIEGAPAGAEVTLTLLDHHSDALSAPARATASRVTAVAFAPTTPNAPEAVHVALRTAEGRRYDWTTSVYGTAEDEPVEPEE